jgi:hypothetical protein
MTRKIAVLLSLLTITILGACSTARPNGPPMATRAEIVELEQGILDLGPGVDPDEARRAAQIAYEYTYQLAQEYQITDPPLIHNMKVNNGLRPRGLCWHWATDMEARLKQENFETLQLYRAIANSDSKILIDHSTAIISRQGDTMEQGIVIDPWRHAGVLFWSPLLEDTRYTWIPRMVVLNKRAIERGYVRADPSSEPLPASGS